MSFKCNAVRCIDYVVDPIPSVHTSQFQLQSHFRAHPAAAHSPLQHKLRPNACLSRRSPAAAHKATNHRQSAPSWASLQAETCPPTTQSTTQVRCIVVLLLLLLTLQNWLCSMSTLSPVPHPIIMPPAALLTVYTQTCQARRQQRTRVRPPSSWQAASMRPQQQRAATCMAAPACPSPMLLDPTQRWEKR